MSCRNKEKHEHKVYNGSVDHRGQNSKNESRRKSPLRMQNDWSEHVSSKGYIYYYNCRTEISQWQRPQDWTLPQMTSDEIKRIINSRHRNGDVNPNKRVCSNYISNQDVESSPKRLKMINNTVEKKPNIFNQNNNIKQIKTEIPKVKPIPFQNPNSNCSKTTKFNDDDMDISPGSSPLSRGSNSDCDKKLSHNQFDTVKICQNNKKAEHNYPVMNLESTKKLTNENIPNLNPYQVSLVSALRSVSHSLKTSNMELSRSNSVDSNYNNNCLSVYQISDLLIRMDAVSNNGDTCHSYRSHRLHAQLSQDTSINSQSHNSIDHKSSIKSQPVNVTHVKEAVKSMQQFVQEQYPSSSVNIAPVSPTYSKSNKISYYLQILSGLIETCLLQLCPQSLNSPSSTSSPGSLKDNTSNISVSTSVNSNPYTESYIKPDVDSPCKKEKSEPDKVRSILQDLAMLKYVSTDVTNTYRNNLADCYEKEAQIEYYKFVRLHSVLYSDLACESKKLKALVKISEINTELLRKKKEDLEKLILILDSRRLPNHLRCDFISNS